MKAPDVLFVVAILALAAPAGAQSRYLLDEPTREERLFDVDREADRAEADRRYWERQREDTARRSYPPALVFPPPPTVCTWVGLTLVCQ